MLRFVLIALSATALGSADETDDLISEDTGSTGQSIKLPIFTPATIKPPFLEQFADESWSQRWTPSTATSGEEGMEEMNYVGRWAREQPHVYKGMENDYGLVLKDDARRHAISAPFKSSIDNKDKTLILQYEVKMQKGLECGGAYLKLLTVSPVGIQAQQFSGDTPYTIMFGPDKCGATNKVHFIFRHFNPVSKKYEEKHLSSPPVAKISKLSTLYTLIINPDQTFEIKINEKSVKRGSLLEDFTPAVTPAKSIDDPEDKKPADWVDEARIADPEATKPEDWNEDAPFEIPDPDAVKPDGWLDDEPDLVSDPDASKPDDWDDEEDGTWIAPKVPNPKCTNGPGCGEWEAPMVKNPAYKGKWFAPKIDNPAYKGIWEPKKISNPDYYEDLTPSNFEPMSGIGFELWTMQGDILFDNILVSHDETDAAELAKDWKTKFAVEEAEDNAAAPKATDEAREKYGQPVFAEDPLGYVTHRFQQFVSIAQIDPFYALKDMPDVAGGILAGIVTLFAIIGSMLSLFTPKSDSVKSRTAKSQKLLEVVPSNDVAPPIVADTAEIAPTSDVDGGATTTRARSATKKA